MTFLDKITNINNLFTFNPSTDFSYTFHILSLIIAMIAFTYAYDFYIKKSTNKFLKKAMKWKTTHLRWTFPLIAIIMLISRVNWIPVLNMKFLWIAWTIVLVWYIFILYRKIDKDYKSKLKNKERFWT